ncbi:2-dehydro-3-deoxygalactonokinase [Pseudophaeobacter arcticus]|uniref:2-dehydro-3-deoxygalactonokinase n=1 Tax=Pseudophaeobacter arcticus TaxID=385492 RepID=UPI00249065D7|nr:2-dehydro-3-deoxygalactonokinase [Pseudophaeobacter arcticus]
MGTSHSQTHCTAALIGDAKISLWRLSAGHMVQQHSFARTGASPAQDLSDALSQAQMPKSDPVLVCGLTPAATSVEVPAKPEDLAFTRLDHEAWSPEAWDLQVLPGLHQKNPVGLMQHSTAQIAGFLALNPKWDGVICLPGEVTHWVQISAAEVVSFHSTLTTGLYAALAAGLALPAHWSESALAQAVADTISRPERLASRLAELRARQLTAGGSTAEHNTTEHNTTEHNTTGRNTTGRNTTETAGLLWGYLLGAELAAARAYWLGQNLALIAPDHLAAPYLAALTAQGLPVTQAQPDRMAIEGLMQANRQAGKPAPAP